LSEPFAIGASLFLTGKKQPVCLSVCLRVNLGGT